MIVVHEQAPAVAAERPLSTVSLHPVNEEPSLFSLQGGECSSMDLGLSPHSMLHGMRPMIQQGTPADAAGATGSKPILPPPDTRRGDAAVLREVKDTAQQAAAPSAEAAGASASSGGGSLAYVLTPIDNTISQW